MYLEYGLNDHGELVHVGQVPRGATELKCPYCGVPLLAKKGEILEHHFAHAGETCRQIRSADFGLPAYDNFNLHLPGKVLGLLKRFHGDYYAPDREPDGWNTLVRYELVRFNPYTERIGKYELTHKGKVPLGDLSLMLFNQFQEPLIVERFEHLQEALRLARERRPKLERQLAEKEAELAASESTGWPRQWQENRIDDLRRELRKIMDVTTASMDLRLYRAQWQRILTTTLYFLEINDGQYYKIGVTTRDPAERVLDIRADLAPHLGDVKIKIVDTWPHRGNVELYFKYRYKRFNVQIGNLTEYYQFEDPKAAIRDLRRMRPKEFTDLERSILAGDPTPQERAIYLEQIEHRRREGISRGMRRAASKGRAIGRPRGGEAVDLFLAKPQSIAIRQALEAGASLRQAAQETGAAINTVRKVKALLEGG